MCLLSYKFNHMKIGKILEIDGKKLYEEVCKEKIEFYKWHSWIDKKISGMYLKQVYKNQQRRNSVFNDKTPS